MKRTLMLLAAGLAVLAISACTTSGQPARIQTPAQIAAQVCPAAQAAISSLQLVAGLPTDAQEKLASAEPIVAAVCAAGTTVQAIDLKTLAANGLPVILKVVNASALDDDVKTRVGLDLTVAQVVLSSVLASLPPDVATASGAQ